MLFSLYFWSNKCSLGKPRVSFQIFFLNVQTTLNMLVYNAVVWLFNSSQILHWNIKAVQLNLTQIVYLNHFKSFIELLTQCPMHRHHVSSSATINKHLMPKASKSGTLINTSSRSIKSSAGCSSLSERSCVCVRSETDTRLRSNARLGTFFHNSDGVLRHLHQLNSHGHVSLKIFWYFSMIPAVAEQRGV